MYPYRSVAALLPLAMGFAQSDQELIRRARHFMQERDGQSVVLLLRPLLKKGIPAAQYLAGIVYTEGEELYPGIPKNPTLGWSLIKRAADGGDRDAQYLLANEYAYGPGLAGDPIPQDRSMGVHWFRKAAAQGLVQSMVMLGNCLREGWGTKVDYKEAMAWYLKAASKNNCVAMGRLGGMYRDGEGVPQDFIEAHAWLNLAAMLTKDNRSLGYDQERNRLALLMGPNQVEKAQLRAKRLMAKYGIR